MTGTSKRLTYIALLLLTWVIGGFLQQKHCCKHLQQAPKFGFHVTGFDDSYVPKKNITFKVSQANFNPIPTSVLKSLHKVKEYLDKNPKKSLEITGFYLDKEKSTDEKDFGIARAKSIQKMLLDNGFHPEDIILNSQKVTVLLGKGRSYRVATAFSIVDSPQFSFTDKALQPIARPFSIKSEGLNLVGEDNFNFFKNNDKPLFPISKELTENLNKTITYLKASEKRQLTITGFYHQEEKNNSVYPNLGYSRAQQIKSYLMELGADGKQLKINTHLCHEAIADEHGRYWGMAEFTLSSRDKQSIQALQKQMSQRAKDIKAKPLVLHFKTGDTVIKLNNEEKTFVVELIRYLNYNPSAQASVTGHTDDAGKADENRLLALERAQFVADYLVNRGLKPQQIQVISRGQDNPTADNSTAEGKAKNRRVVISIIGD